MLSSDTKRPDADVVVVGFGGAGAAAAITARDLGADVVIVEKQPADAHTPSTAMLGGGVMTVTEVEAGARYLDACARGRVPYPVSRAWAAKAWDLAHWAGRLPGITVGELVPAAEHPRLPCASAVASASLFSSGLDGERQLLRGRGLFQALRQAVADRGIPVLWQAPARRLIRSGGEVAGLEVGSRSGEVRTIAARRAVVLATGGFGASEQLKREFLPVTPAYFYGNPVSTGDGVLMAQAAGARLWHMNLMMGRGVGHFETHDSTAIDVLLLLLPMGAPPGAPVPGYVITDGRGHRYADESAQANLHHSFFFHMTIYDPEMLAHPRVPSYWFFDESRRRAGPLAPNDMGAGAIGRYQWSADNSAEISQGWISAGGSIAEAAAAAGVADPAAAEQSVAEYNAACQAGRDPWGRPAATLTRLDRPPFYCVPLWPGGTSTIGGPERDELGRVIDVFGQPIPGLYSAGELGQAMGPGYPGRYAYYSEVLCSGRIAGENAAHHRPRGPVSPRG